MFMLPITTAQGGNIDRNPPTKPRWRSQSFGGVNSRLGKNFGKNRVYAVPVGSADCLLVALTQCAATCGEAAITSGDIPIYDVECWSCLEEELTSECLLSLFGA